MGELRGAGTAPALRCLAHPSGAQGHCQLWPRACAGGNSKIFSFYFLEQFKSTTACLTVLEDVKTFGGKGNVFLVTPHRVK